MADGILMPISSTRKYKTKNNIYHVISSRVTLSIKQ